MGLFSKKDERKVKDVFQKMGLEEKAGESGMGEENMQEGAKIIYIRTASIRPNPFQPRRLFGEESLKSLAESLTQDGMLQPITVMLTPDDVNEAPHHEYTILAGERRWRAAQMAELEKVPAIVRPADAKEMRRLALIENVQRVDLNTAEMTRAIGQLMTESGDTVSVSKELGLSERSVQRYIKVYRVVYSNPALISLFERQAGQIDLTTALRLATLAESIMHSGKARELFDSANSMGIRDALKLMLKSLGDDKKSAEGGDLYNIAVRKSALVFTVRYRKSQKITSADKRRIQKGLSKYFERLGEEEK